MMGWMAPLRHRRANPPRRTQGLQQRIAGCRKKEVYGLRASGDLLPPSPPAEKARLQVRAWHPRPRMPK
jgi:hypothetical protein